MLNNNKKLGQKIKSLRQEVEMSQEELGSRLNISRTAVSQLERGNRSLKAFELLKISKIFGISVEDIFSENQKKVDNNSKVNEDIEFNKENLKNSILYILAECGGKPNFGKTVLYKLLYFSDFDSFERFREPITGLNYYRQKFGPVPQQKEQYGPTIEEMIDNSQLKKFKQEYYGKKQERYIALEDYEKKAFSAKQKEVIDNVLKRLSSMNALQIQNYAHGDYPWRVTKSGKIIPYKLAFNRDVPYSQSEFLEDWQNAGGHDALKDLGEMSEDEIKYYDNL